MFAKALEANAPQCDHLVIPVDFVERFLQDYDRVLSIADEGLFNSARHRCRGLDQTAAIRIVTAPSDDGPHGGFDLCPVRFAAMMESPDRFQRKNIRTHDNISSRQGAEVPLTLNLIAVDMTSFGWIPRRKVPRLFGKT